MHRKGSFKITIRREDTILIFQIPRLVEYWTPVESPLSIDGMHYVHCAFPMRWRQWPVRAQVECGDGVLAPAGSRGRCRANHFEFDATMAKDS
jgi:hypothetical protein